MPTVDGSTNGHAEAQASNNSLTNTERLSRLVGAPPTLEPGETQVSKLLDGIEEEDLAAPINEKRSLAKNPYARIAITALGLGAIFGTIAAAVGNISSVANRPNPSSTPQDSTEQTGSTQSGGDPVLSSMNARLMSDLAIGRQASELEKFAQPQLKKNDPVVVAMKNAAGTNKAGNILPGAPPDSKSISTKQPNLPRLNPPQPVGPPRNFNASARADLGGVMGQAQDPTQLWQQVNATGDFYFELENTGTDSAPAQKTLSAPAYPVPSSQGKIAQAVDYSAEAAVLQGHVSNSGIPVGSRVRGYFESPVVFEAGSEQLARGDRFTLRLVEDLRDRQKRTVLPAGTAMIARLDGVSPNGIVRMSIVAVANDDGDIPMPDGALALRGASGAALVSQNVRDRGGEIAGMDIGQFMVAGLGRAAQLFNQPTSSTVNSGIGGVVSTYSTPPPNIAAGMIEGGVNAIIGQLSARNQQAVRESINRPNVWMIAAGTPVEIFANQTVPGFYGGR